MKNILSKVFNLENALYLALTVLLLGTPVLLLYPILFPEVPTTDFLNSNTQIMKVEGKTETGIEYKFNSQTCIDVDDQSSGDCGYYNIEQTYANWSYDLIMTPIGKDQLNDPTCKVRNDLVGTPCFPNLYTMVALVDQGVSARLTWTHWVSTPNYDPEQVLKDHGFRVFNTAYYTVEQGNWFAEPEAQIQPNNIFSDLETALNSWTYAAFQRTKIEYVPIPTP